MEGRNNHGGKREGAGRKPKSDEQKLLDSLSPYHDKVIQKIGEGVEKGDFNYIKLFMEYFHGKPKQLIDLKTPGNEAGIPIATWANNKNDSKEPAV